MARPTGKATGKSAIKVAKSTGKTVAKKTTTTRRVPKGAYGIGKSAYPGPPAVPRVPKPLIAAVVNLDQVGDADDPNTLIRAEAHVIKAAENLLRLRKMRHVAWALEAKKSQDAIAASLGVSQATVSRIARQVRNNPHVLDETPTEIIERRAVGEISTPKMMEALLSRGYTTGQYDPTPGGDGYLRGSFDEIQWAVGKGLLTDAEYEQLARAVSGTKSARATR